MTLSFPRPVSIGAIAAAFAWSTLSIGALVAPTPASAKSDAPYYTVELAQPVAAKTTTVAGGIAWFCAGTTCVAQKGNSRPLRLCRELQREQGEIASFTAKGEELAPDALARCNA